MPARARAAHRCSACRGKADTLAPPPRPPAGNVFDLGCASTTSMYHGGEMCFFDTRAKLVERPWAVDDLEPLLDRLCRWGASRGAAEGGTRGGVAWA